MSIYIWKNIIKEENQPEATVQQSTFLTKAHTRDGEAKSYAFTGIGLAICAATTFNVPFEISVGCSPSTCNKKPDLNYTLRFTTSI